LYIFPQSYKLEYIITQIYVYVSARYLTFYLAVRISCDAKLNNSFRFLM